MEASIQEVARLTGTTSRTLRHYDAIGLLAPSRVGDNGYRWYDERTLVRLQRILLLRDLGLGLAEIGRVLDREHDEAAALRHHLDWLRQEQRRLARQAASVRRTIDAREKGEGLMAEDMLDGFDHTRYEEEVEQRWGKKAYADSDRWWTSMDDEGRATFTAAAQELSDAWRRGAAEGLDPAGPEAQALAERHVGWLAGIPGTPGYGEGGPTNDYLLGLADMYVADERFAATYGGTQDATFVRDAIREWVHRNR